MKKVYNQPEVEVIVIEEEVIATASTNVVFDPENILGGDADKWLW